MESVNFVHDVNMMRKTLKSVYAGSEDLKALNSDSETGPGNCRVQVLPVCWRHLLDFPKRRENKGESDLADADAEEDNCKWIVARLSMSRRTNAHRPLARGHHR